MAGGMYNDNQLLYRKLLAKKLQLSTWHIAIWSMFMGMIAKPTNPTLEKYGGKVLQPTGQPIEVLREFSNGGVEMEIPVLYPLTGQGIGGNQQLLGNEETQKIAYKKVKINQKRHGVNVLDNKMSKQVVTEPAMVNTLMGNATSKLSDWFARWNAYNIYLAFLQGASEHLVQIGTGSGGGALTTSPQGGTLVPKSHQNFYVAGYGRAGGATINTTPSNTRATYEQAVANAILTLNAGGAKTGTVFSTAVINQMVYLAGNVHRIQPINVGGSKLYPIVIDAAQAYQLEQDANWIASQRAAFTGKGADPNNPLLGMQIAGIYGGALILIDECVPSIYCAGMTGFVANSIYSTTGAIDNAGGGSGSTWTHEKVNGVQYGLPTTFMSVPRDTGSIKPAILFGASAIAVGVGKDVGFETEEWDYKQKQTEGADLIIGHEVCDITDDDNYFGVGAPSASLRGVYENCSSLVMATYSPTNLTFAPGS